MNTKESEWKMFRAELTLNNGDKTTLSSSTNSTSIECAKTHALSLSECFKSGIKTIDSIYFINTKTLTLPS